MLADEDEPDTPFRLTLPSEKDSPKRPTVPETGSGSRMTSAVELNAHADKNKGVYPDLAKDISS
jgi:hypothetical protein